MPSSSFDNFNAGIAALQKGFGDIREAKKEKAKRSKETQELAQVEAFAKTIEAGGMPNIPEEDRPMLANAIRTFGKSALGKVLAVSLGENLPKNFKDFAFQGFYKMIKGQKSGDDDMRLSGMEQFTEAMKGAGEYVKMESYNRRLGSLDAKGTGVGGLISGSGAKAGNTGNYIPQVVTDENGKPVVVQIDKDVLKTLDAQLRKLDPDSKETMGSFMGSDSLTTLKGDKFRKVAESEINKNPDTEKEEKRTPYHRLSGGIGSLGQEYLKSSTRSLRSQFILDAVDSGYGQRGEGFTSTEQLLTPKVKRKAQQTLSKTPDGRTINEVNVSNVPGIGVNSQIPEYINDGKGNYIRKPGT